MKYDTYPLAETDPSHEALIDLEMMQELVVHDLHGNGRIDQEGKILPLEIERRQHDPERWVMGRGPKLEPLMTHDIVPNPQQAKGFITEESGIHIRNRSPWDPEQRLYQTLTRRKEIALTAEQVTQETADWQGLVQALDRSGQYDAADSNEQLSNGLHLTRKEQPPAEFARTRIYVQAGHRALGVTRDMIEKGADFRYAKIWYPSPTTEPQIFREDTPIFEVETFTQLESTIDVLRQLKAAGRLPEPEIKIPIIGAPVEGLDGVYVGQPGSTSFNIRMGELFGPALYRAYLDAPKPASQHITQEWVAQVATKARELASQKAHGLDVDPHHHAFLKDQPVDEILEMLEI